LFFHTVPSANTLVRWEDESAFASVVQARPCPTFGRPVHLRGGPHRLRPGISPHALRIPSCDGHPALRGTAVSPASEVLPPLLDIAPLIRAPEGLEPSRTTRCSARTTGPSATLSPSTDFPVLPVIRLSAPWISPWDEEGFSSCLTCPCHRAVANAPPERPAASVSLRRSILPSPLNRGFGLWIFGLSRSPVRLLPLRPDNLLTIPWMALSIDSMHFVSSVHAIPATGL
jgi:hypothetical protein